MKLTLNEKNVQLKILRHRLSSSSSVRNIGRRSVSSWHDRWQQSSCGSSLCPSSPGLLSSLVFRCSYYHLL